MSKWIRDQAIEQGCRLAPHRIQLWCPGCGKHHISDRAEHDYPEAVMLELECENCGMGGFEDPTYWDNKGNHVNYDVKEIGTPEHPLHPSLIAAIEADKKRKATT